MTPRQLLTHRCGMLRGRTTTGIPPLCVLALAFVGASATAGSVYKCEDAYGTTVYSDRPCGPQPHTAIHNAERMRKSASSGENPAGDSRMRGHANRIEESKRAIAEDKRQARRDHEVQARRAVQERRLADSAQSGKGPAIPAEKIAEAPGGAALVMGIHPAYLPAGVMRCEDNSYSDVWCP